MVDTRGRFVWYELMTTDVDAARDFYTDVVGWNAQNALPPGTPYTLFLAGANSVGGLMQLQEESNRGGGLARWLGYVEVGDIDAATDQVAALGGIVYLPPTSIGDISRFAVVADEQKALFALISWLKPRAESPVTPRTNGRIGWHELFADDCERAAKFYGDLFGWRKSIANSGELGTYQLITSRGQTIGGIMTKPPALPAPFWLHYFTVSDIDAAASRVTAGGGQIINGPAQAPDGSWIIQCTDPQKATFALIGKRSYAAVGFLERLYGQK
jgi:predicted enzyme related to lactoylglutathione lyase